MVVWWLLSLFYLFCQNPISMVLALLSGILLFVAVKLPQEKQNKRRNKRDYRTIENSMRKFDEKIQNNSNSNLFK